MLKLPYELNGTCNLNVNTDPSDYQFLLDCQNRRFSLTGPIYASGDDDIGGESDASRIARAIIRINQEDQDMDPSSRKRIVILINSGGGDVAEGFALVAAIETSETPVDIVCMGRCMSMAFLICLAGHRRLSFPYTQFLMHDGEIFSGGSTKKVQDQVKFEERLDEEVVKPFVLRHSKMTEEEYVKIERKEFYMTPEDALEHGFIDGIIEKPGDMP